MKRALFLSLMFCIAGFSAYAGRTTTKPDTTVNGEALCESDIDAIIKQYSADGSGYNAAEMPIVYSPNYDITIPGLGWLLRRIHPFDSTKYSKVYNAIAPMSGKPKKFFSWPSVGYCPRMITEQELAMVHTADYLEQLTTNTSRTVAGITEIPPLRYLPHWIVRKVVLDPMKYATAGTVLGAALALRHGYAINLSGGYHHAKAHTGEGFCVYADIPLAVHVLWKTFPHLKIMVVDLDAHQGNGLESIFMQDPRVTIFDVYNGSVYPNDRYAKQFITFDYPLRSFVTDQDYLGLVERELPQAIAKAKPDLIIYNAGSDIYEKDQLGCMSVSAQGIIKRDAFVVEQARQNNIPILMVLSGGYTPQSAGIITQSIKGILKV
jgi:histone deacetylase 11